MMTHEEIRTRYRWMDRAYDRVTILAELNNTTPDIISDILGLPCSRHRCKVDSDEATRLYNQGLSDRQIADLMGLNETTINAWRKRHGLPRHHHQADYSRVPDLYRMGLNDRQIGTAVGLATSTVYDWRHKQGLPPNRRGNRWTGQPQSTS